MIYRRSAGNALKKLILCGKSCVIINFVSKAGNFEIRAWQDSSDYEWELWNYGFWETIVCALTGHFFMMRFCEKISSEVSCGT